MKTFTAKKENIRHNWYIVDATDKILGRLATKVAYFLIGKHKSEYTPHVDIGDYIIVINAEKISVTGKKKSNKIYYRHSGYIGGIKKATFEEVISLYPEKVILNAVKGMLPKNALGRSFLYKLKVFAGDKHLHAAQKPKILEI